MKQLRRVVALLLVAAPGVAGAGPEWREVICTGAPHARHEAGFVASGNELVLLGGRRAQPVDVLDPATLT